jgi:hypothetical protein
MWLFPIVFMCHEFEEIIGLPIWFQRNRAILCDRFPKAGARLVAHVERTSPSGFALIIAQEFAIVSLVTVLGAVAGFYHLYAGFVVAFLLHLVVHVVQFAIWRGYIPAIFTVILTAPFGAWVLVRLWQAGDLMPSRLLVVSVIAAIFAFANLIGMHRLVQHIL